MKIEATKTRLKKVGEKLRHKVLLTPDEEMLLAEFRLGHRNIIESFRNHHNAVLAKSKWREKGILFASRLKKRQTLVDKLSSRQTEMDLTRMHDIAGCRLIFLSFSDMLRYRSRFIMRLKDNQHFRMLEVEDRYDYIKHPRQTGYRGIHDIYEEVSSDLIHAKIEVQYRTMTQHAWATALEIWDQFHTKGAKFGLEEKSVQELFSLYSELLWRHFDRTMEFHHVGLELTDEELYKGIRDRERELGVLKFFSELRTVETENLNARGEEILIHRYISQPLYETRRIAVKQLTWDSVQSELFPQELDDTNDLVFVQIKPKLLRRAYNNYFDDAVGFVKKVRRAMMSLYCRRSFLRFRHKLDDVFILPEKGKK